MNEAMSCNVEPFLKWAGGKRWLTKAFPSLFNIEFGRYIEPFLGSGAVFFHVLPQKAILSDVCKELILTYKCIREDWEKVVINLLKHSKNHNINYYYNTREKKCSCPYEEAAKFIYMNRTCWNGLYRVNKKGDFNVPIGSKDRVMLGSDNFQLISECLKCVELYNTDFEEIINASRNDDLIFIDPPYTTKHSNNGFIKYNEKLFSWNDQVRLYKSIRRAAKRGSKIILTNSCHSSITNLYESDFKIKIVERDSVIAGKSSARGKFKEAIITHKITK
jgi:DNA adenine methylase